MDFADLSDRAAHDVLVAGAGVVGRMSLVAHLADDLAILRLLGEDACLLDGPAERLLHVDVLAEVHRHRGDRRVHVVRRGDHDGVDILLLLEHLAVVAILRELRQVLRDEPLGVLAAVLRRTARVRFLLRLGRLRALGGAAAPLRRGRRRVRRVLEALDGRGHDRILHVAERDQVLAHERLRVAGAHAESDHRDVEGVARGLDSMSEHVPGHDGDRRPGARYRAHELAS